MQVRARHVRASRARGFPLLSPYSIDARSNASQSGSVIPTNGAVIVVVGFGRVVANARVVIGASEFAHLARGWSQSCDLVGSHCGYRT